MNSAASRSGLRLACLCLLLATARPARAAIAVDHTEFDALLARYVVEERYVDYARWHASAQDAESLRSYVRRLEGVDPESLGRDSALAYWINLYNAVTLRLILDHYPVASIKDLGGRIHSAWEKDLVEVNGRPMSLNAIENDVLRPRYRDPRVHFALNCASMGCPPLPPRAFVAENIDERLERVTARAVQDPYWVDLSACGTYGSGVVRLSKIFDWYSEDFGGESGTRSFLAHYLDSKKLALKNGGCSLDFNDYDWSLNLPPSREETE